MDAAALKSTLVEGNLNITRMAGEHIEPLRAACARDTEIWDIYPVSMLGENFDAEITRIHGTNWLPFAILLDGKVIGMSCYIDPSEQHRTVEIGGTFIEPAQRGMGINGRIKTLMIEHAFACGFTRIQFNVDTRNTRSIKAVLKLGATKEGVLRKNRITWTGYVRDSAIFGLLKGEWQR